MNKSIQIITFLLLWPILGFSQNRISVGANLNTAINILKDKDSQSQSGQGYSIGVQAQYAVSEKVFLRSGINLQRNKFNSKQQARWSSGDISSFTEDVTITSSGVPVDFGYLINSKNQRMNYFLAFRGLINLNLENNTEVEGLGNPSQTNNEIHKLSPSIGLVGGIEIQVSDKIILGVEPNLRYGSIWISPASKSKIMESGITLRIRM